MCIQEPSLLKCFGITPATRLIALVGGGGKTTLMYALAREMLLQGRTVVTTTTTKIFPPASDESPHLVIVESEADLLAARDGLLEHGHVTIGGPILSSSGKLTGISKEILRKCLELAHWVVVEADGAAGRPLKAPEAWEPVIPEVADLVIPVVGLDCLGKPANAQWVFRLNRFLEISGLREGAFIDPEALARALTHDAGGLKGVGAKARVIPFLNKADVLDRPHMIEAVARAVLRRTSGIRVVAAGTLRESVCLCSYHSA